MGHIHTNPGEYDATASAFIVRVDTEQPRLLLHKHRLLGTLLQIGGHIELTETPWQAICHEIPEETGYELAQLRLLQPELRLRHLVDINATLHPQPVAHITHPFPNLDHYHSDISYAFTANTDPRNTPAVGESTDFRWVTVDELRALKSGDVVDNVREIGMYVLTRIVGAWEPVDLHEYAN